MATQIADAVLHIDEALEKWQRDVLIDHMRLQEGVIATGARDDRPHIMIIEYNMERTGPVKFIRMLERHGYHAERIG